MNVAQGLRNLSGQNNCFLNASLQTLWHLPAFRKSLEEIEAAGQGHDRALEGMTAWLESRGLVSPEDPIALLYVRC